MIIKNKKVDIIKSYLIKKYNQIKANLNQANLIYKQV